VRDGSPPSNSGLPMILKVHLSQTARLLEYSSKRSGIRLAVGYPPERQESFLGRAGFEVDQVAFLDLGPTGQPQSTLTGAGAIQYSRYPASRPVPLSAGDFLSLDKFEGFYVREIAPSERVRSLRIRLGGVAGKVSSGSHGNVRDRRITYLDALWQNPFLANLVAIMTWLVPTVIAGRNLYGVLRARGLSNQVF
jgi:hypothetical protein